MITLHTQIENVNCFLRGNETVIKNVFFLTTAADYCVFQTSVKRKEHYR